MFSQACWRNEGSPVERLNRLAETAAAWSWTPEVRAWASTRTPEDLLAYVQRLPRVVRDEGSADVICDPRTLLVDGGDCDPLSALLAAGLRAKGLRASLVWVFQRGDVDHVSCLLWRDGAWRWADAMSGAPLGVDPWRWVGGAL